MKALVSALALTAAFGLLAGPAAAAPAKKTTQSSVGSNDPVKPAAVASTDPAAEFLAKNAKQPGVITLPDGLQYKVVKSGDPNGPSPKEGDVIKVHYEGKLADGTVFDSSIARGHPMLAPLGGLVPAWMEALPKMHPGDEWTLFVPPNLGYGPEGRGPIPPNSVMIFRIQLIGMLAAD